NATALKNFFDGGFLHAHPDDPRPSLADAAPIARIYHEDHGLIELETEAGVDAVSSVLIRSEIGNDLVMAPGINAATEWLINFPLRQYDELSGPPYSLGHHRMRVYDRQGESSFASDPDSVHFSVGPTITNYQIYAGNAVSVLEFGQSQP